MTPLVDFKDYYIDSDGNIFRERCGKIRKLKPIITAYGYYAVGLSVNGITSVRLVHRLVMQTFSSNPHNKPTVNHKNGIKTDNRLENLEWATYSENIRHAYATGLNHLGPLRNKCSLTEDDVIKIRSLKNQKSQRVIAGLFGVGQTTIRYILIRKTWKHI